MAPMVQDSYRTVPTAFSSAVPQKPSGSVPKQPPQRSETPHAVFPVQIIELMDGIWVRTSIPPMNYPALRSGFVGHPLNPRWSATKVMAWKMGRVWRHDLSTGKMVVRPTDSLLVNAAELHHSASPVSDEVKPQGLFCFLPRPWNRS